jgi:hypothetical protein
MIGAFVLWKEQLFNELYSKSGRSAAELDDDIKELIAARLILYDEGANLFVITDHFKDEPILPKFPKQLIAARTVLEELPESEILSGLREYLATFQTTTDPKKFEQKINDIWEK